MVLSCLISAALSAIVSIAAMPSILDDNEHRVLFFLCLILQFIIILVLSIIGFVIKYIFKIESDKRDFMNDYWWFLMPAIFLAIFSDKIDEAARADKKLKKVILVICAGVVLITLIRVVSDLFIST